jgi:membrane protease YdiL (CAAX protease family)
MSPKTTDSIACGTLFFLMMIVALLVPSAEGPYRWLLLFPFVGAVVFFGFRFFPLFGPAIFLLLCYVFRLIGLPPLSFLLIIPIAVYTVIVLFIGPIRRATTWLEWGKITPRLVAGSLVVVVVSSIALLLWYNLLHPDIAAFTQFIPALPLPQLLIGGLGFALLNATVEEVIFRGIIWEAVATLIPAPRVVLIVTAFFFGIAHFWGVPSGVVGACLAFIYGVMLGIIRMRSEGLLMVIITHIFADIVIFCILLDIAGRI